MFEGAFVALVTPFRRGKIDFPRLIELVDFQIRCGINGIVVCATTGESCTLSGEEKISVIKTTIRRCKGRVPVIAYTGTNDTFRSIAFTKTAASLGVDGALVVVPYYNKPSQEGMFQHFKAISQSVPKVPLILYNVPSRTVVSIKPETIARLSKLKNIVAVKEAISDMEEIKRLRHLSDITILSGEDSLTCQMMELGAKGVISVLANIMPDEVVLLVNLCIQGNFKEAAKVHEYLLPLSKALFLESNPVPVKTALALAGKINNEVRLPLVPLARENLRKLKSVLRKYKS
ncbi:MAG: 4-hydroxy-tetrahydrodipicolinate synthase [Planctomycetes bacterium]|nr:4-hydroxy-tetrahydrodipicolinate synthase [Planctomycetota bacterium]